MRAQRCRRARGRDAHRGEPHRPAGARHLCRKIDTAAGWRPLHELARISQPDLYLSACGTTAVDRLDLLDEAIHLTGAYQLAGYPQVIGTLWEINDVTAADVASAFYARLQATDGRIDTSLGALALHDTIRELAREYAEAPWLWAAYLHTGC